MKTKYIKPEIEFDLIDVDPFMVESRPTQCHCYEFIFNNGCRGCTGNCGCNHWDPELGELIPGC